MAARGDSVNLSGMSLQRVRTPCIGVCSTTFGDTVCRGCKRFLHEIVNWNGYTEGEKQIVWQRLDRLLRLTMGNYFRVTDPVRLRQQLEFQNIRFQLELSPEGWVPSLLKAAGHKPLNWPDYGLEALPDVAGHTPKALYLRINEELHALAQAHYDRNHQRPARPRLEDLIE